MLLSVAPYLTVVVVVIWRRILFVDYFFVSKSQVNVQSKFRRVLNYISLSITCHRVLLIY